MCSSNRRREAEPLVQHMKHNATSKKDGTGGAIYRITRETPARRGGCVCVFGADEEEARRNVEGD